MTLHATCCKSSDLADVQTGLDEMDLNDVDKYTLPLLANPVYRKRMADVLRDFQRLDYFWTRHFQPTKHTIEFIL